MNENIWRTGPYLGGTVRVSSRQLRQDGTGIILIKAVLQATKKALRFGLFYGSEAWGPLYPSICPHGRTYLNLVCSHGLPLCRSLHNSPEILATRIKGVFLQWQPIQESSTAPQNGDCDCWLLIFVKSREKLWENPHVIYLLYKKKSATDRVGRTGKKSDKKPNWTN